ncbi:MAG: YibE/F family protein [Bacillota bacterium]
MIKKALPVCWFVIILLTFSSIAIAAPEVPSGDYVEEVQPGVSLRGRVMAIISETEEDFGYGMVMRTQVARVRLASGAWRGQVLEIENVLGGNPAYDIHLAPGDDVLLYTIIENDQIVEAHVESLARDRELLYLVLLFVILLIVVGGWKGVKASLTLAFTVLVVFKVLLPLVLQGYHPILLTILVAAVTTAVTLLAVGGVNRKTVTAITGTLGGVVVAGLLGVLFGSMGKLTGLSGEEAQMLMFIPQGIEFDFRGLLFAGMIIGALGAVMDVAMSIASALEEIKQANPTTSGRSLWRAGMNVGRDIMGTMSNTLILAYTGGSLPLLLLFLAYDTPLVKIVNLDLIATEIIRAVAGSTGLVAAIPITALVGAGILPSQRHAKVRN